MKRIANYLIALAVVAFTFTSCEDVPSPFGDIVKPDSGETVVIEPKGAGTEGDPYNIAAVLEFVSGLGADTPSEKEVYFQGFVTETTDISAQYGNATFNMSDTEDGTANKFTVYRAKGLGGESVTDEKFIKVGDFVVICGKVTNYKGNTPETVQGAAYVVSVNGEGGGGVTPTPTPSGDAKGSGTLEDPYNAAAAIAYAESVGDKESDKDVYIKGKVVSITDQYGTQYGNATFIISDDGNAASTSFTIYRALYLGNQKYTSGDLLKEKDDVIICGKVTNFKGNTPETVAAKAYLYSLNGKTEAGGGGDTPTPGTASGTGTQNDPFNVAAAVAKCKETGETATSEIYYVKGIVSADYTVDSYKNATFDLVDAEGSTEKFTAYRVKGADGANLKEGYKVPKGATVIVSGKLVNYKGNTPETAQNTGTLISVNGTAPELDGESGGGEQGGGSSGGGEVSGNAISVTFSELGMGNQEKPSTLTLSDGTTLTFEGGGNSNAPAYYNTGTAMRLYPKNTMVINAGSKKIAAIEIVCDEYNGTLYNASGDIAVGGNKMTIDGNSLKYAGPNASTATVANISETTGAPSQLRMKMLTITYSE